MGPWLFLIMINDLYVPGVQLWKYVDDITMSESVGKNQSSNIQSAADELTDQAETDRFQLNVAKCKEIRVSFAGQTRPFAPVTVIRTVK